MSQQDAATHTFFNKPAVKKTFIATLVILFTASYATVFSSAYTQKDVDASFNYYHQISTRQRLSPNDRLAILNRIVEKYSNTPGVNLDKVKSEIKRQQHILKDKPPLTTSSVGKTPTKISPQNSANISSVPSKKNDSVNALTARKESASPRLWDAYLEETGDEFVLNIVSDRPESKNYFVLKDPDPAVPPKIILDLYGVEEAIKDQSRKEISLPPTSATLEKIKIAQFEKEPTPVVRVVFYLKKDIRHTVKDTNSGVMITLIKDEKDKGKQILASAVKSDNQTISSTPKVPPASSSPSSPAAATAMITASSQPDISSASKDAVITASSPDENKTVTSAPLAPAKSAYRIEPGDVLSINVYPAEDLSRDAAVGPEGDITLPLIGVVRAGGNTTSRLADSLTRAYSKYIANPEVSVTVKQYARRTVFITGELKSTGGYPYKDGLRLLELISQAGGFTDRADRRKIKIIRGDGSSRKTFTVDAEEIVRAGDLTKDFVLEAGDIVEVPEGVKRKISILGDVKIPGYYDYKEGLKLIEAISMSGGFTDTARINKVSILRKTTTASSVRENQPIVVNLDEILKGNKPDIEILPDDTIYVPKKTISTANWWVSNVLPWLSLISLILVIRGGL